MLKFTLAHSVMLMRQLMQAGACHCFHSINARLAKLLLSYRDRTEGLKIKLTHENMSEILGFSRPAISEIALQFKEKMLIGYSRGSISILDQPGLEAAACECYEVSRRSYDNYNSLLKKQQMAAAADQNRHLPTSKRSYQPNVPVRVF